MADSFLLYTSPLLLRPGTNGPYKNFWKVDYQTKKKKKEQSGYGTVSIIQTDIVGTTLTLKLFLK